MILFDVATFLISQKKIDPMIATHFLLRPSENVFIIIILMVLYALGGLIRHAITMFLQHIFNYNPQVQCIYKYTCPMPMRNGYRMAHTAAHASRSSNYLL